jgi:hypothetical protein
VAGIKLTPAVLGILLLYNKQWKEVVCIIIYGCIFFFLPFLLFEGGFSNLGQMLNNVMFRLETYSIKDGCTIVACVVHFFPVCSETVVGIVRVLTYVAGAIFFNYHIGIMLILCVLLYYGIKALLENFSFRKRSRI